MPQEEAAAGFQEQASRLAAQRLTKLIDQYCSRYSHPNTIHRIDTLELELGPLPAGAFGPAFLEQFEKALAEALPPVIREAEQAGKGDLRIQSALELLTCFLQNGHLPWWADARQTEIIPDKITYLLQQAPATLRALLREQLMTPAAALRLAGHLPVSVFLEVARLYFTPGEASFFRQTAAALPSLLTAATNRPSHQVLPAFRAAFLAGLSARPSQPLPRQVFLKNVLLRFSRALGVSYSGMMEGLMRQSQAPPALAEILRSLQPAEQAGQGPMSGGRRAEDSPQTGLTKERNREGVPEEGSKPAPGSNGVGKTTPRGEPASVAEETFPRRKNDRPDPSFSQADELYLPNAGLVLLAPFLPNFFQAVGLVEDGQFVRESTPHRAVHLLHFLAAGEEELPEYMAPLLKVLCGIPLDKVLDTSIALSKEEKAESELLLEVVIGYAPILKSMSPDGFRGTFLLRDGILSSREDHWLVRVERQAYDVVMERLPWQFNVIKLPWVERLVMVEW